MKKSAIALLGAASLFMFTSCTAAKGDNMNTVRRDYVYKTVVNTYLTSDLNISGEEVGSKTDFTTTNKLDKVTDNSKSKDYYTIYLAEDINSSLFVDQADLTKIFDKYGDRTQSASATTVLFEYNKKHKVSMYSSEEDSILDEIYDKKNGLSQYNDADGMFNGLKFVTNTKKSYSKSVDLSDAYKYYKENKDAEIKMTTVYLPMLVVRNYKSQDKLLTYMLHPIYSTVTVGTKELKGKELVDSTISTLPVKEFEYKKNGKTFSYISNGYDLA